LAAKLKQADRSQRNPYPAWKGSADCWMGGATGVLGRPASISPGQQKPLKGCVARFHVAIGLALQGLGKARISQQFASKNGRLKAIGWRKKKRCWGIDIGTAAIKAVCLTETDEGLEVVDSYFEEFSDPVCRTTVEVDKAGVVKSAVEKMLATKEIADTPVWANIAASNLVNRFVRLPPVSDKQAAILLESEIDQRIPIPKDDLAVVRWMGPKGENEIHGRPAVITGAKKDVVRERMRLLTDAGLTLSGFLGDTLAIVNFAAYEFAESLRLNESNAANEIGSEGSDVDDRAYADDPSQNRSNRADQTPAVALVECGAATTNLVIVSDEAHWAWSIESGGENLTAALARQSKTGQSEAEQLKRNPAALTLPSKDYASVEQRQDELRMRIERVFEDAMLQNPRFRVIQSWCLGGGCLAHQWIRRLMLKK
jgi:Tfp pilus assembly PilM family ATPase